MNKKILFIEDDLAIIDVYSLAFKIADIPFDVITLGEEAIKKIKNIQDNKEAKPSLVLLDLLLPDMNGLEILKEIRQNQASQDMKVFVLTNYTSAMPKETDTIKPDKFILKSDITPTQLVELIKLSVK